MKALNIQEERSLAGRIAGIMFVGGAASAALLLILPGIPTTHWRVTLAAGFLGAVWGMLQLAVLDRQRVHPALSHCSACFGYVLMAVVAGTTGGADSPARFFLFFSIFYVAYFYPTREAVPHFAACLAVEAMPLFYDDSAIANGLIGELVVVGATYAILGGLILSGKRLLVQLREAERELSLRDPLTNLPNRRALMNELAEHAERAASPRERSSDTVGFVLIDLDHFKSANTVYGHPGGDRVLVETGRALARVARKDDLVARLGGDEFAIVCPGMTPAGLAEFGMRVLRALREADKALDMPEFRLTASVGSALFPRDAQSPELLLESADRRMRNAKGTGRDRAIAA